MDAYGEFPNKNYINPSQTNELFVSPGWTLAEIKIIFFFSSSSFLSLDPFYVDEFVMETIYVKFPANVLAIFLTFIID